MAKPAYGRLVEKHQLEETDPTEIRKLAELCRVFDKVELKLNWELMLDRLPGLTSDFFYYYGSRLAGYLALDGFGTELECTGMVAPEFRRKGIFSLLLDKARHETAKRGAENLLLVSYKASASGTAFALARGARYLYSEFHMKAELQNKPGKQPKGETNDRLSLHLQQAGPADISKLALIMKQTFGSDEYASEAALTRNLKEKGSRYYFAIREGQTIGQIGVLTEENAAYIRGVGIVPEHRGKGYGRLLLAEMLQALYSEGFSRFSLDVVTGNSAALGLYESCGFWTANVYNYYEVL